MSTVASETICAIATGNGVGAIAVIRVSGPDALTIASKVFSKSLLKVASHTLHFGTIAEENGQLIDEVLVSVFHEGKSFTGESSVEISCHGSQYIQQRILKVLMANGCRLAEPGEFTMRAYLNGKMDLSQAEAVADLIAVQNQKAHELALNQMRGGLSNELKELRERLIHFASMMELELDFGEEDVEFADRTEMLQLVDNVLEYVVKLIHSFELGNALKNGVPIALVGRPNAGKSTMLNALLKEERAIVSDIPGTTRDTIEEGFQHEGIAFRLIDTAGIRVSEDEIEQKGIERTMEKINQAKLVVYLFDSSDFDSAGVIEDVNKYVGSRNYILIATKKDIYNKSRTDELTTIERALGQSCFLVNMKESGDRDQLLDQIYQHSVGSDIASYDTVVSNARHLEKLELAAQNLSKAKNSIETGISGDFIAMDIRQAMFQIGQITADISTDDLLGNIFSNFCIGK